MDLPQRIGNIAKSRFGITMLRPYQSLVIIDLMEQILSEEDHVGSLVVLPTGFGKTLCFSIPIFLVPDYVLIIYPLLSLMTDQIRRFQAEGITCVTLRGGQTKAQRQAIWKALDTRQAQVIVTNAECLENGSILSHLASYRYSMVVIDEAHTVVQWGMRFRPSYGSLGLFLSSLEVKTIAAFTATASDAIIATLQDLLFLGKKPHLIKAGADRDNISYHAERTLCKTHALQVILSDTSRRPAVVFCPTRKSAEKLALLQLIKNREIPVRYYHAGLGRSGRETLEAWFKDSTDGVLFSTNAFGMGVDKKNIRTVVHSALPADVESYLQESGRAGRDGKPARAYVLLDEKDQTPGNPLLDVFLSPKRCIRAALLSLMGEEINGCGGCDVCDKRLFPLRDGEREILKQVKAEPFRHTPSSLAKVLTSGSVLLTGWKEWEVREAIMVLHKEGSFHLVRNRLFPSWKALRSPLPHGKVVV